MKILVLSNDHIFALYDRVTGSFLTGGYKGPIYNSWYNMLTRFPLIYKNRMEITDKEIKKVINELAKCYANTYDKYKKEVNKNL